MKRIFTIVFLTVLSMAVKAQVKVSGTVKSNKNKPLIAASITLKNTYDGAVTDSMGRFSFTTTEKGSFILEAKSNDHKTVEQTVVLDKEDITISFVLRQEINELAAVT